MKKLEFTLLTTLEDGSPVSLNKLDVGGVLSLIDSTGNASTAPDGDYTMNDGSIVSVNGGTITAIAPAPDEDTDTPETMATEPEASGSTETEATDDSDAEADDDLSTQIQTLVEAIAQLQSSLDAVSSSQADMKKDFESQIKSTEEKFSKATAKSILEIPAKKEVLTDTQKRINRLKYLNGFQ